MTPLLTPPPIRCSPTARNAFQPIDPVPPTPGLDVKQHEVVELTQRVAQLAFEQAADGAPHVRIEPPSLPRLEEFRPCLNIGIEEPAHLPSDPLFSSDEPENTPDETDQLHDNPIAREEESPHPDFVAPTLWLPLPRMHNFYPWPMPPAMAVPPGFNLFFHWRWEFFPQAAWYSPVFMPPPFEPITLLESPQQEAAAL